MQPEPPKPDDDALLVARAAEGDVASFEALYRGQVGRIYALCLRMSRDRGEAEELVQDTFVRAWEKLGTFKGQSAFSTWLHRVAVNVVIEAMRAKGRWRDRIEAGVDPLELAETASRPAPGTDVDLERAVAALPPRARLVFVLHDVEGYKHREIAELTGSAVGSCKANLHRARALLRDALSDSPSGEAMRGER